MLPLYWVKGRFLLCQRNDHTLRTVWKSIAEEYRFFVNAPLKATFAAFTCNGHHILDDTLHR